MHISYLLFYESFIFYRALLEKIINVTLAELLQSGSFTSLIEAVKAEKDRKAELQQTILK